MKKAKGILCLVLSIAVLFSLSSCGKDKKPTIILAPYDKDTQFELPESKLVTEIGEYALLWDKTLKSPVLKTKSGTKWQVAHSLSEIGEEDYYTPISAAGIFVKYYDPSYKKFFTVNSAENVDDNRISVDINESRIRITYYFDEFEFSVPVSYALTEEGLSVSVSPDEIDEHDYTVISVAPAPFLASAQNTNSKENYLFVPSGSGALVYTGTAGGKKEFSAELYGDDLAREKKWNYNNEDNLYLPVFGAVDKDKALYGIITEGDEASGIGVYAGDADALCSGVYPIFNIRSYNTIEINFSGTQGLTEIIKLADKRSSCKFCVRYASLNGENANYSGIAEKYREYLNLEGGVSGKTVNLTFLGGLMADRSFMGFPYQTYSATTTAKQAEECVSELSKTIETGFNVKLKGFGDTGLDIGEIANGFTVNKKSGNEKELKALAESLKKNNSQLFMDYDILQFTSGGNGYSKSRSGARDTTDYNVKLYRYDMALQNNKSVKNILLLRRSLISSTAEKLLKSADKYGFDGISLDTLGKYCYSDFSDTKYYTKMNMAKDVTAYFEKVKKSGKKIAVDSANGYAAANADVIFSVPTQNGGNGIFDESVPFYGMVFAGTRENSAFPVNLSTEPRKQFLRSLETANGLSFVLAYDVNKDAVASDYSAYLAADYKSNKSKIEDYYSEAEEFYRATDGATVKSHKLINSFVRLTEFSNGVKICINLSDEKVNTELGVAEANGFIWR